MTSAAAPAGPDRREAATAKGAGSVGSATSEN